MGRDNSFPAPSDQRKTKILGAQIVTPLNLSKKKDHICASNSIFRSPQW